MPTCSRLPGGTRDRTYLDRRRVDDVRLRPKPSEPLHRGVAARVALLALLRARRRRRQRHALRMVGLAATASRTDARLALPRPARRALHRPDLRPAQPLLHLG